MTNPTVESEKTPRSPAAARAAATAKQEGSRRRHGERAVRSRSVKEKLRPGGEGRDEGRQAVVLWLLGYRRASLVHRPDHP